VVSNAVMVTSMRVIDEVFRKLTEG